MGGFQSSGSELSHIVTLHPDDLTTYLNNRDIAITEKEIWDKSKGDVLAKSLVLLQVIWFLLQVLMRAVQRLVITDLEIVTLAYAILNFVTYFCWLNKPLDVTCPFITTSWYMNRLVYWYRRPSADQISTMRTFAFHEEDESNRISTETFFNNDAHSLADDNYVGRESVGHSSITAIPSPQAAVQSTRALSPSSIRPAWRNWSYRARIQRGFYYAKKSRIYFAFRVMCAKALNLCRPVNVLTKGLGFASLVCRDKHSQALDADGTYLSGTSGNEEDVIAERIASGIAVIFGAIHCLAWNFELPTVSEQMIWRISSVLITCLPLYFYILVQCVYTVHALLGRFISFSLAVLQLLYISARLSLLVQMFVVLRKPNPGIYTSVTWLDYIPHF